MNRSESVANLAASLAKAQAEMRPALKDTENPHFRSRYADLASTWEACREALTSNGLAVVQLPEVSDHSTVIVETVLLHESGEYLGGRIEIPITKQDAQGVGSAITYARRYSLAAVVGIAPDDDDGEAAVGRSAGDNKGKAKQTAPLVPTSPPAEGPKQADPKTAEYHERIRGALRQLFGEDKEAALSLVEELSTWTDTKTGEIKAAGVKDYRKLTGKRLEILTTKLEAEAKKKATPPADLDDDLPF